MVVGIPLRTPSAVRAYVSNGYKGGLWATPGVSTDGVNIFGAAGEPSGHRACPRARHASRDNGTPLWLTLSEIDDLRSLVPCPSFSSLQELRFSGAGVCRSWGLFFAGVG